jgi:hypothetical protein
VTVLLKAQLGGRVQPVAGDRLRVDGQRPAHLHVAAEDARQGGECGTAGGQGGDACDAVAHAERCVLREQCVRAAERCRTKAVAHGAVELVIGQRTGQHVLVRAGGGVGRAGHDQRERGGGECDTGNGRRYRRPRATNGHKASSEQARSAEESPQRLSNPS